MAGIFLGALLANRLYYEAFEARDGWLRSGMETGVNEGYAALDELLADGQV